jgi:hypothetical protein
MAAQLIWGSPASAPAMQQGTFGPHASKYPAHADGVGRHKFAEQTNPSQQRALAELEQSPPLATQQGGGAPEVADVPVVSPDVDPTRTGELREQAAGKAPSAQAAISGLQKRRRTMPESMVVPRA